MESLDLSLVLLFQGGGASDGIHAGNRLSRFFPDRLARNVDFAMGPSVAIFLCVGLGDESLATA